MQQAATKEKVQPWTAIPNSSQSLALRAPADHILYHGARGPGKTVTQLMRFRARVGLGYGAFWRGVIFDREYKNLSDLVRQSKQFFSRYDDGAHFLSSAQEYKWVWPDGEELLFRHAKKEADYDDFHGHEYPFIGWNELTKHPTAALYDKMMSTNRSSFTPEKDTPDYIIKDANGKVLVDKKNGLLCKRIPLEVFSTTNPNGPGHSWVKRRFIDAAPSGQIVRREVEVFNPRTQQNDIVVKTQMAIFGSYRENIYLDPAYVADLEMIQDENRRRAWLHGDWSVISGGALDDVWDDKVHVIEPFNIPDNWYVDRAFDWGSTHPFSVGWFAEANGEEIIMPNGSTFAPVKGSIIQIAEWYGSKEIGTNVGLKIGPTTIAEGIRDREVDMMLRGAVPCQPSPGPADNQIRDVRDEEQDTIAVRMEKKKIHWTRSDKSRGSRRNGLELARERLRSAKCGEGPGMYVMRTCPSTIAILPTLPRNDEDLDDVDTDAEDHLWDMWRYRILKGSNRHARSINVTMAH